MKKKIIIFRNGSYGDALTALPSLKLIEIENKSSEIFYLTLQNKETKFFKPDKLFKEFGLNFKFLILYKENFYLLKLIYFFLSKKISKIYYLKEEPTAFFLKNKTKFSLKLNILTEFILFKLLNVGKIIGLEEKYFNFRSKEKESLNLIKRFYKNKINENNIINIVNNKRVHIKNTSIILCIGGKFKIKDWGLKNWIKLLRLVIENNKKTKFIIIGSGKIEVKKAKIIKSYYPKNCELYLDKPFDKLISTISNSRLYIGHDTANMHLAALLGLKTISIFSSRETKGKWFPIGTNQINFYKEVECSNCKAIDFCEYDKKCINSFKPNLIFKDIRKYL